MATEDTVYHGVSCRICKSLGGLPYATHAVLHELETDPGRIRAHLRDVLESPAFRGSRRSSRFLEFAVECALTKRLEELKEKNIAVAVFERAPGVDLSEDTIVRVGAREVRKRLAQYYVSDEAAADEIRIDLAPGTYVPQFHHAVAPAAELRPELVEHRSVAEPHRRFRLWHAAATTAVIGALTLLAWFLWPKSTDALTAFWAPLLSSRSTVLVGIAHPVVYQPTLDAWKRDTAHFAGHPPTLQAPFDFPEEQVKGSDMKRVRDQFVGYADLVATGNVTSFLAEHQKTSRYRLATNIEFSDLREGPVVLVGAFTNRWTTELTLKMRFHFNWGEEMRPQIEDPQTGRVWAVTPGLSDPSTPEDYFMIARVVNSPTGKPFLILGGLKQAGTEAAGFVATNAVEIGKLMRQISKGWESKNLQMVLRARAVGGRPSELELVAQHVW